ncbi:MAG: DUF4249 domain-containing protein [Bacteroidales bacterium]
MKRITNISLKDALRIVFSFVTIMLIEGCEKVINVDLNQAAPHIVIEGLINDQKGPYTVMISKSGSYFNQPVLQTVSGAKVILTSSFGTIDSLIEIASGVYITSRTRGIPGWTYTLKVISEDQEYGGSSTMFSHVNIDSLTLVKTQTQRLDFDGNSHKHTHVDIHCFFKDPEEKNFYRIKVFRNDSINTQNYRLYDDQYTNGEETELRVANATADDTFRVELLSLDQSTYEYYRTLSDLLFTNPIFGSTPANPNTNLSNGALGYFGACAISTRTIIITQSMIDAVK